MTATGTYQRWQHLDVDGRHQLQRQHGMLVKFGYNSRYYQY